MTPLNSDKFSICLERLLDSGLEADWQELVKILESSAEARHYYVRYMQLRAVMVQSGVAAISRPNNPTISFEPESRHDADLYETMILPAMTDVAADPVASEEEVFHPAPSANSLPLPRSVATSPVIRSIAAGFAIMVVAGLLTAVLHNKHAAPNGVASSRLPSPVAPVAVVPGAVPAARITRQIDAEWIVAGARYQTGQTIVPGDHLSLLQGFAELTFEKGAKVILEAPAEFTVVSDGMLQLTSGRLAAKVPVPAHGFTVTTRQGSFVDLGTEFGVLSLADGVTQLDVFKGSVRATEGTLQSNPGTLLRAGQAATVTTVGVKIDPAGPVLQRFVRSFDSGRDHLDLVDLFSGGDGGSQLSGTAIDANTGQIGRLDPIGEVAGDGKYHPSPPGSIIDGSYVPDGTRGSMQVDSAGHSFKFPPTCGHSFNRICTGGTIRWPNDQQAVSSVLDGVDYSVLPHRVIVIHSNQAATINLNQVRRLQPGQPITHFRCTVGNTYTTGPSSFGVFVLVDGVARLRASVTHADGKVEVDVPLKRTDRFLSLATTDGEGSIWGDWAIWCDPVLSTGQ